MIISKTKMQRIADEIGDVINKHINIMDELGVIIASTDISRIGTLHGGARRIIEEKLTQLTVDSSDNFIGAKNGINLPLFINEQCVGVVGITGSVEEVGALGSVIKKMTEILISEAIRENQKQVMIDARNNFALEWLYNQDSGTLSKNANILGIQLDLPRIISVTQVDFDEVENPDETEIRKKFRQISDIFRNSIERNSQQLLFVMGMKLVCFFVSKDQNSVFSFLERLSTEVEEAFNCRLVTGIGTLANEVIDDVRRSFREAEMACQISRTLANHEKILMYNSKNIYMILNDIQADTRKKFIRSIFSGCSDEDISRMMECLHYYITYNGSLSKASAKLYIHKNTLQYRLEKIRLVTGYNPRKISEIGPLLLALYFSEINGFNNS